MCSPFDSTIVPSASMMLSDGTNSAFFTSSAGLSRFCPTPFFSSVRRRIVLLLLFSIVFNSYSRRIVSIVSITTHHAPSTPPALKSLFTEDATVLLHLLDARTKATDATIVAQHLARVVDGYGSLAVNTADPRRA